MMCRGRSKVELGKNRISTDEDQWQNSRRTGQNIERTEETDKQGNHRCRTGKNRHTHQKKRISIHLFSNIDRLHNEKQGIMHMVENHFLTIFIHSSAFRWVFLNLYLCILFRRPLFVVLSIFVWPLHYLSFFNCHLWYLISFLQPVCCLWKE